MATGSSAAATAWRTFLREKGSFSVWNARYPTRRPGSDKAPSVRCGGPGGNQTSSVRASSSASACSSPPMREQGDQWRVGLNEHDLYRVRVGRLHLLDDARRPPEERRPHHRRPDRVGAKLTLEARRDVRRGEQGSVFEPHAVAQRERPG